MSSNTQRLGATLSNRMNRTARDSVPTTIELGKVNADLSITTDGLMTPIPKGDYMVNLMLSGSFSTGSASHSDGVHSHRIRGITPGDRILVAWCGNEPVVIAVLDASATLTYSGGDDTSQGGSTDSGSGGSDSSGTGGTGTDGVYPTVVVTPITGGNRVTITDATGPQTFDVMDGKTPVKGKDYFTAEEVEGIVTDVVNRITSIIESSYYKKTEIDKMFQENIVTADDISSMLKEVFGEK